MDPSNIDLLVNFSPPTNYPFGYLIFNDKSNSDFEIICGKKKLYLNKNILSKISKLISDIITKNPDCNQLNLQTFDSDSIILVFSWIYGINPTEKFDIDQLENILQLISYLKIGYSYFINELGIYSFIQTPLSYDETVKLINLMNTYLIYNIPFLKLVIHGLVNSIFKNNKPGPLDYKNNKTKLSIITELPWNISINIFWILIGYHWSFLAYCIELLFSEKYNTIPRIFHETERAPINNIVKEGLSFLIAEPKIQQYPEIRYPLEAMLKLSSEYIKNPAYKTSLVCPSEIVIKPFTVNFVPISQPVVSPTNNPIIVNSPQRINLPEPSNNTPVKQSEALVVPRMAKSTIITRSRITTSD